MTGQSRDKEFYKLVFILFTYSGFSKKILQNWENNSLYDPTVVVRVTHLVKKESSVVRKSNKPILHLWNILKN